MAPVKLWLGLRSSRAQLLTALRGGSQGHSRSLSTSQLNERAQNPQPLGERMSFVVEEIDNIRKKTLEKGAALEKLRAWKDRNNTSNNNNNIIEPPPVDSVNSGGEKGDAAAGEGFETGEVHSQVEIAHPWPEWIELMERLLQQNYFDKRRTDEDRLIDKISRGKNTYDDEDFDIFKDFAQVRNACLHFGRDRFDILRSLSRKDIQIIVGYGCPSLDRKVVSSGKRMRAYVRLDEGDVCSTCKLRGSCEKAYLVPREDDGARTLDVMRILLTFGLDPIFGSAENKLHTRKTVKASVCNLLKEVVKLSAIPLDPNLPKPVFKRPPPKVKQPQPPPRKRVGRDDIEMKAGDWLCPKCDFMNFAKNHNCLQCDVKRPKRQLNPGEWECPGCNFLNYRRNMTCYNCDHKRPEDEYTNSIKHGRDSNRLDYTSAFQRSKYPTSSLDRQLNITSTSKAWNNDFDDDESDGADVAAFEYADSPLLNGDRAGCKGGGIDNDTFDFEDLHVHGKNRIKEQDEIGVWKKGDVGKKLEMDSWSSSSDDGEGKGFDEDEDGHGLIGTSGSRAYERWKTPPTNNRQNGSLYYSSDPDDNNQYASAHQGKGSETFMRPSLSSARVRVKKTYESSGDFDEDDNEDSFESDDEPSHFSGMKWGKGKERKSILRRDRGTWNKKGRSDTVRRNSYESEAKQPYLSERNWSGGKDARLPGRGMRQHQNISSRGDSFSRSLYKSDRGPSFSSKGRGRTKNGYGFADERSAKGNYGRANGFGGASDTQNHRRQRDSLRGGSRESRGLKNVSDLDDEPNWKAYGGWREEGKKGRKGWGR